LRERRKRAPTARQRECFETYARTGDQAKAAEILAISVQRLKANVGEYYRRIDANSGVQAAFLTWGPKRDG
jgi:hypothetical protein